MKLREQELVGRVMTVGFGIPKQDIITMFKTNPRKLLWLDE